jgi:hypothetical protein
MAECFPNQCSPLWTHARLGFLGVTAAAEALYPDKSEQDTFAADTFCWTEPLSAIGVPKDLFTQVDPAILTRHARPDGSPFSAAQIVDLGLAIQLQQTVSSMPSGGRASPPFKPRLYQISGLDPLLIPALERLLSTRTLTRLLFQTDIPPKTLVMDARRLVSAADPAAAREDVLTTLENDGGVFVVSKEPVHLCPMLRAKRRGHLKLTGLNREVVGVLHQLLSPISRSLRPESMPPDEALSAMSLIDLAFTLTSGADAVQLLKILQRWCVPGGKWTGLGLADTASMRAWRSYQDLVLLRLYDAPHPVPPSSARRKSIGPDGQIYHAHHIYMKAMIPEWKTAPWNLVRLRLDEHFDAHLLLAEIFEEHTAPHTAVAYMINRFGETRDGKKGKRAAESLLQAYEAASELQRELRTADWQCAEYRQQMSAAFSAANVRKWRCPAYRKMITAAIMTGRREKFYADPERVARAKAAHSEKTSAERHWRHQPVNIYDHATGMLMARRVNLTDFCKRYGLSQAHLHGTLSANRTKPSGRTNRAHHKGLFARRLRNVSDGNDPHEDPSLEDQVIGSIAPAVPQPHWHAKLSDIYRSCDDACVARGVVITQFCKNNSLGITFSQSALSRTAHADRSKASSTKMPTHHKGFYARYLDDSSQIGSAQTRT